MTVKEAKDSLQSLIDSLNDYDENREFVLNVYDNFGAYYRGNFDDWSLDITTERISLNIE
mgnify:CR=1 FL=1